MNESEYIARVDMIGSAICEAIGLDPGKVTLVKIAADFNANDTGAATIDANLVCTAGEAEAIADILRGNGHNVTLNVSEGR